MKITKGQLIKLIKEQHFSGSYNDPLSKRKNAEYNAKSKAGFFKSKIKDSKANVTSADIRDLKDEMTKSYKKDGEYDLYSIAHNIDLDNWFGIGWEKREVLRSQDCKRFEKEFKNIAKKLGDKENYDDYYFSEFYEITGDMADDY